MSAATLSLIGTVTALVACAWAGLLVMVQEGPGVSASPGTRTSTSVDSARCERVTRVSRIALLFVAGVAASEAIGWWYQPFGAGMGRAGLALALLYLIAEGLPRSAAVLMPKLAAALDPFARLTLSPFTPLVGLISLTTLELNSNIIINIKPGKQDYSVNVLAVNPATNVIIDRIDFLFLELS